MYFYLRYSTSMLTGVSKIKNSSIHSKGLLFRLLKSVHVSFSLLYVLEAITHGWAASSHSDAYLQVYQLVHFPNKQGHTHFFLLLEGNCWTHLEITMSRSTTSSGFQGVIWATLVCNYVTSYEVATNDSALRHQNNHIFLLDLTLIN
jgi:hypothetical protein